MTLKSEVAELRYEVAELSCGELRLTFTTAIGLNKQALRSTANDKCEQQRRRYDTNSITKHI